VTPATPRHAATGVGAAAAVLLAGAAAGIAVLAGLVRRAERAASAPDIAGRLRDGPEARATDALVVFGAEVRESGPTAELRARLDHAVALWRMGVAPLILVSGGMDGTLDEVETMAAYLVAVGVPAGVVFPVRPGGNTRMTLQALGRREDRRYLAVTSQYHVLRIRAEARRQGLRMAVSTPPSTPETRDLAAHRARVASELFALVWYALPPRMTARVSTGPGTLRHVAPNVLAGRAHPSALLVRRRRTGP